MAPVSGIRLSLVTRWTALVATLLALGIKPAQIDGTEDKDITLKLGANERKFTGQALLLNFILPNFYFHVTTAYDILRHNGVELGKRDYIGTV